MFGYGYRWLMPLDYRTQEQTLLDKLSPLGQYLVGEPFKKTKEYYAGGGDSPLAAWCEEHGGASDKTNPIKGLVPAPKHRRKAMAHANAAAIDIELASTL